MQVGVIFPQTESGTDAGAIREYAQAVEAMGYRYIAVYDHVAGAHPDRLRHLPRIPFTHESLFHEVFVLFGYLAAVTRRLGLAVQVLVLPQRETVLVAKQAAEVDILSGGRLRLGVGVGWNDAEYGALGADFHTRGRRQEEQLALLRRLWTEPLVTFQGRWHSLDRVGINPLPVQRPIPIWFGGSSPRTLERAARLGDGWIPLHFSVSDGDPLRATLAQIRTARLQAGRNPDDFGLEGRLTLTNTLEDVARQQSFWRDVGATHLSLNTMGRGFRTLTEHLQALDAARQMVLAP